MITCPFCGAQNTAGAAFCNSCGGALSVAAATQAQAAQAAARTAAQTAMAQRPHPQFATGRLPPQSRLGKDKRYLVLKTIGQGGMAAVYLATDTKSKQRPVAIKEMSQDGLSPTELKEALASFNAEANILIGLDHPNLPKVYGTFTDGSRYYLVMEYIEGQTLEQKQAAVKGAALPEAEVMSWAGQLCAVLAYLHRHKIIFRDLKPANVMVTSQGQVKLIDFGIARFFSPNRTRDTQALGTPGYAPPEQYGKAQTDERADIYALGCTLYQLLTGYEVARTPFALPPMHTRNPHISPHIQLAIERATRLDRNARFANMQDFAAALLHPSGLYFRSGEVARSLRELLTLCKKYPQEAEEQLYTGRIEGWLRFWKEPTAANVAHAAVIGNPASQAAGLAAFLRDATQPAPRAATGAAQAQTAQQTSKQTAQQRTIQQAIQQKAQQAAKQAAAAAAAAAAARVKASIQANAGGKTASKAATAGATATAASAAPGTSTQTVVIVSPHAVNFGQLVAGQRGVFTITLRGQNGGSVAGKLTPLASWISLDRTQFSGVSTLVQVTAETSKISKPGIELATIQVSSGSQFLYIPVTVDVTSAPVAPVTAQSTVASKATSARANGGAHGASAASATRPAARATASRVSRRTFSGLSGLGRTAGSPHGAYGARFFSSLALALLLSVGTMLAVPHYAGQWLLGTSIAPELLAVGLLLVAALLGTLGAYFGAGRFDVRTRGRFLTTTIGAVVGLIIALSYGEHTLATQSRDVLTIWRAANWSLILLPPFLVSLGAAVGADRQYSAWMLAVIRFIARYAPFFVMAGLILVGGWTGFVLTNAFLYGWFIPLGVIFGVVFGAAVAGRINSGLRSLARLRP